MYNFNTPTGFTEKTGHFTQLVWKSTTEVGCAAINCGYSKNKNKVKRDADEDADEDESEDDDSDDNQSHLVARGPDGSKRAQGWYVVCEYTPAGNVVGMDNKYFRLNVKQGPSSQTSSAPITTSQQTRGASIKAAAESKLCLTILALITVAIGMIIYK